MIHIFFIILNVLFLDILQKFPQIQTNTVIQMNHVNENYYHEQLKRKRNWEISEQ